MGLTAQARLRTEGAVIGAFLGATVGAIAMLAWLSAGVHPEHQAMSISSGGNAEVWSGTWQAPFLTSASSWRRLEDEYHPLTCRHAKARGLFELLGLTPSTLAQLEVELAAWQIKKLPPVVRRASSKTILADVFVRIQQHMYRMGIRAGAWAEIRMIYTKSCQRSATSTFTSVTQIWCRRMQCVSHSRPMERWRGRLCQTAQTTNTGPWSFAGPATPACLDARRRREVQRHVETY